MEYDARGPILKVLLLIGGDSTGSEPSKEQFQFPDGRPVFEHALETLHSAVPSASTIYISLHDENQLANIEPTLKQITARAAAEAEHAGSDDHQHAFPALKSILDQHGEVGPAAGLLASHEIYPHAKWLVLACHYPLLPPFALQQLILEYQAPLTCFENESGVVEPLIAIWRPEALKTLKENLENGRCTLEGVVDDVKGTLIKPLRGEWITHAQTRAEWDAAMDVLAWRGE